MNLVRPMARTESGSIRGSVLTIDGKKIFEYLGVPYAIAERFRRARPVPTWTGVRDATRFGPLAPQIIDDAAIGQEKDSLTANLWLPRYHNGQEPVPAMIWIHGGGYIVGSSGQPETWGAALAARHRIAVIGVSYRLGALGFSVLDHLLGDEYTDAANLALYDLVDAIRWLRRHADVFGVDAENITIAGQSAGGAAVATLLGMPQTEGLFRRAIVQSGTAERVRTPEYGRARTEELLARLAITPHRAHELLQVPLQELLIAQQQLVTSRNRAQIVDDIVFQPSLGEMIPMLPFEGMARGTHGDTDLIVGTNLCEAAGSVPLSLGSAEAIGMPESLPSLLADDYGVPASLAEQYLTALAADHGRSVTGTEALGAYLTDRMQRQPSNRMLEARRDARGSTYSYLFAWEHSPGSGARHSLELPFVFHNLANRELRNELGDSAPIELAHVMSGCWARFARFGDPGDGWLEYWPNRLTRVFDSSITDSADPLSATRMLLKPYGVPARQRPHGTWSR